MKLLRAIDGFFFAPRSAVPFGLMRILWAAAILWRYLLQLPDTARLYSDAGVFPRWMEASFFREQFRFSLLDLTGDPMIVTAIHIALLACLVCMLLGIKTRAFTIASVVLVVSFHERNALMHSGGDTLLRLLGILLMLSPGIEALSVDRLRAQWANWRKTNRLLPLPVMPSWPKRLLLWQALTLYLTSFWSKISGDMWRWGTVVAAMLWHPHYSKIIGTPTGEFLASISRPLTWASMALEAAWVLLLVPQKLLRSVPLLKNGGLRRALLCCSVLFHIGIELAMHVGFFLPAMLVLFAGLLEQEDIDWLRRRLNAGRTGKIAVLYDGHCGFCRKSVFSLAILDALKRLELISYHDEKKRMEKAPDLAFDDLDRALHIRLQSGRTEKAFRAFRVMTWHLPLLWPLAPFLYVPGAAWIGEKVYTRVARKRVTCSHGNCAL